MLAEADKTPLPLHKGRQIVPRHDVDRVLLQLRKSDVDLPAQSKKMQWLQKDVFPGETPEQIHARAKSLYEAAVHEHRDISPTSKEPISLASTERPIRFSKAGGEFPQAEGVGENAPSRATQGARNLAERLTQYLGKEHRVEEIGHESLTPELRDALQAVQKVTGKPVRMFRDMQGNVDANGIHLGDSIWVNERSSKPVITAVGHEFGHAMEQSHPELYAKLQAEVERQGLVEKYAAEKSLDKNASPVKELVNDAMGDALTDPEFLSRMRNESPGLFKRVADAFTRFLGTLTKPFRDLGSNKYLKDVGAFRDKLASVLREYETNPKTTVTPERLSLSAESERFSKYKASQLEQLRNREIDRATYDRRMAVAEERFGPKAAQSEPAASSTGERPLKQPLEPHEKLKAKAPDTPEAPVDHQAAMMESVRKAAEDEVVRAESARLHNKSAIGVARAWTYMSMLMYLKTLPKIAATSTLQVIHDLAGEGMGLVTSRLFPKLSELSPRYGKGWNTAIEKKAMAAMTNGADYASIMKTGRTTFENGYAHLLKGFSHLKYSNPDLYHELEQLATNWQYMASHASGLMAIPGRIHGIEHAPPMLAEYTRSFEHRMDKALSILGKTVKDPTREMLAMADPRMYLDVHTGAMRDALRAGFRGENALINGYRVVTEYLRKKDSGGGRLIADILDVLNPFVNVSSNVLAKTTDALFGGVKAGVKYAYVKRDIRHTNKLADALEAKGIAPERVEAIHNSAKMTPDQADYILRNIQAQGIGFAAMALGAMYWDHFGGHYQKENYHRTDMPKTGDMTFMGVDVPHHVLEHPFMQVAQTSAMIARGWAEHGAKGAGKSALAAAKDLPDLASFTRSAGDLSRAIESTDGAYKYLAQMVASRLIPGVVVDQAKIKDIMDNDPTHPSYPMALLQYMFAGEQIGRKVRTAGDYAQSLVPKTDMTPNYNIEKLPRKR